MKRLKILVSAYSFLPGQGSEPAVGWNIVNALAEHHDVWVITNYVGKEEIDQLIQGKNINVKYFDMPGCFGRERLGVKSLQTHYYIWQLLVRKTMKRLQSEVGFDLCHHLTYVKYWAPTGAAWLDIPFVWGPIGGAEKMPLAFLKNAPLRSKVFESIRWLLQKMSHYDPFVRKAAFCASCAIPVTPESRDAVKSLNPHIKTRLITQIGVSEFELKEIDSQKNKEVEPVSENECVFIYVGNFIYWKGIHLALKGFAKASMTKAKFRIIGSGEEEVRLRKLTNELGIQKQVEFLGRMTRDEVFAQIQKSNCLVLASLHDSGGFVVAEAMANSKPVICLDLGGPSVLVPDNAGIKVPALNEDSAIEGLAESINRIATNPQLAEQMGKTGRRHVEEKLLWSKKALEINEIYEQILMP